MWRVVWRPLSVAIVFLTLSVQHKQAANVGGSGQNVVQAETTTEETTTSRGLLVNNGPFNFTVQSGTKVTLHCRVHIHDENSSVSWLKRSGDSLQLLSVNSDVFKEDPRYKVSYMRPVDWQLFINPVNFSDQGHYECQISSLPPIVYSIYLHVLDKDADSGTENMDEGTSSTESLFTTPATTCNETSVEGSAEESSGIEREEDFVPPKKVPELEISDERNLPIKNKFYNSGSTIELRCLIIKVPTPTQFIIWKHNSSILNYDTTRGGISVKTDILPDGAKSQLFIANVGPSDSGNYSCSLGEEAVTWVSVVVITGETPAAMQHGSATMSVNVCLLTILSSAISALS